MKSGGWKDKHVGVGPKHVVKEFADACMSRVRGVVVLFFIVQTCPPGHRPQRARQGGHYGELSASPSRPTFLTYALKASFKIFPR
jgi:hypothetical protein